MKRRDLVGAGLLALGGFGSNTRSAALQDTIERCKRSVVAVGTFHKTRAPAFAFRGTGFVVGDGLLVATNAHVLPSSPTSEGEVLAVALPMTSSGAPTEIRVTSRVAVDAEHDLALLRLSGSALPALALGGSETVREGDQLLVTGFPLGTILGTFPVTHQAMIAAIAPVAIPQGTSRQLDPARVRQLKLGAYDMFQLDATIHPGNSGSPLYRPDSGQVVGVVNMALVRELREGQIPGTTGIAYAVPERHLSMLLTAQKPR